jgi:hypothetical protein
MDTAAIYVRYSSSLQSPTSIEDQERLLCQYVEGNSTTVADGSNALRLILRRKRDEGQNPRPIHVPTEAAGGVETPNPRITSAR